jgi:hypothetical protein
VIRGKEDIFFNFQHKQRKTDPWNQSLLLVSRFLGVHIMTKEKPSVDHMEHFVCQLGKNLVRVLYRRAHTETQE